MNHFAYTLEKNFGSFSAFSFPAVYFVKYFRPKTVEVVSIGTNPTFKAIFTPPKDSTFLVQDFFFLTIRHQYWCCTF